MEQFNEILQTIFGPRSEEFSDDLRNRLRELWRDGLELGIDLEHECGKFNPTTEGPVGPEGCDACKTLNDAA